MVVGGKKGCSDRCGNGRNIGEKKHEKLEEYQGLREKWEMFGGKTTVVPVAIDALGALTLKPEEWLLQNPGTASEISVQNS